MIDGFKIIDMDTHVGPRLTTLDEYMDPSFKARYEEEMAPYIKITEGGQPRPDGTPTGGKSFSFPGMQFNRYPNTPLLPEHTQVTTGGKADFVKEISGEGLQGHHRKHVQRGVEQTNSAGRLLDMDEEGRDIDFMFGANSAGVMSLGDPTLCQGFYDAYHRFLDDYTSVSPERLRSHILVHAGDVEQAINSVKTLSQKKWATAVWLQLPVDFPVDDPTLDPLYAVMNDQELPLIHHSFYTGYPWFPGYRDMWGNSAISRTAAHPWGAARLCAYLICSGLLDRYPNLKGAVAEVGQGWFPHWLIRLGEMVFYVSGTTVPTKYKPLEYAQMGRFLCCAEPFEGHEMTRCCLELLGENGLMHQSDYPHAEAHFPDTAQMVMDWPIWEKFPESTKAKYMGGNAESFLRLT